jgi:hypothetical protein
MKKINAIAVMAASILFAVVLIAGCTQEAGNPVLAPPGDSGQYSNGNGGIRPQSGIPGGYAGNMSDPGRQFRGQNFLTNETLLIAAAGKLGVSEETLRNALDTTMNTTSGRPDFTRAAQQLGITQQELTDSLGLPSGGYRGGRSNVSTLPGI